MRGSELPIVVQECFGGASACENLLEGDSHTAGNGVPLLSFRCSSRVSLASRTMSMAWM